MLIFAQIKKQPDNTWEETEDEKKEIAHMRCAKPGMAQRCAKPGFKLAKFQSLNISSYFLKAVSGRFLQ